ncbi:pseudouridine synthase [Rickenella mellea]|uniref:tRNA pseudouridine synthase 1 n=1 Tax=Rickenella mellea TaxID=50990 RepID=A0A4Y7QAS7_9AGAM|nr:pseudouridine synthase [Rickenella mellea]
MHGTSKSLRDASGYPKSRRGKEKQNKNKGRRRGTRTVDDELAGGAAGTEGEATEKKSRLPKRQCALLIGYSGSGYNGMQIQANTVRTIEGTLFQALVKAGAVSEDNADDPVKVNLGRAARTDAGVHAAGNVVSIKMITVIPDLKNRINDELPPEIRLSCDSRKYTYFFPSYLLIPPKPGSGFDRTFKQQSLHSPRISDVISHTGTLEKNIHSFWQGFEVDSTREDDMFRKKQWRIGPEDLANLRTAVQKYEGTHNYHNFTVGREFRDRSNQRHMKKIEVADPAVFDGIEWISVMFHGQSFMLHQRKMMAVLVLSCRTKTPPGILDELYGPRMVFVPKMPALGLLLEYPIFESYNDRVKEISKTLSESDPDYRPPIDLEVHREKIDSFKQEHIYSRMRALEEKNEIFDRWIRSIDSYSGGDLLYFNDKGTIPEACVLIKGEKRNNPFREKKQFDATDFPAEKSGRGLDDVDDGEEDESDKELSKLGLAETEG